jgi:glucose/arabinose dehydrogenase
MPDPARAALAARRGLPLARGRRRNIEALEPRALLASVPPGFVDAQVVANLSSPTAMAIAPDGRLFVAQQNGAVRVIKDGQLLPQNFATVNANSSAERGLLGITFDPNFATNHYVYVYYTAAAPTAHNRVSRFTAIGDIATGIETTLLDFPAIGGAIYHMGGALHFGPDGKLYIAVGDHQDGGKAQLLTSVFGKILRVNADGSIPEDNPFYNQASGVNRAIWARGLRNPFTFAFQSVSGRMFINDVGQETWEEINTGRAGGNYGWPVSEGPNNTTGYDAPFYYYDHGQGCSITGAAFYNPAVASFPPQYVGQYFFGDYCGGWIRTVDPSSAASVSGFATGIDGLVDVDVASDGAIYYLARGATLDAGHVRRITHATSGAPNIDAQPQDQSATVGESVTFGVSASGFAPLRYQWQRRAAGAAAFADLRGARTANYTIDAIAAPDDGAQFRVIVRNGAGQITSAAATFTLTTNQRPTATITTPIVGTTFRAGDTIDYGGAGTDPEDGNLPPGAFTWQVDYYTNGLARPFIAATSGATTGSFVVPTTGVYKRPDVFYRIILTVRDSGGRTHTTTRDITPITSTVTLRTNVPGLRLALDGQPMDAPFSFGSVVNFEREIGAPSPQTIGDLSYGFAGWSDGGAVTHTIHTPETDTTYTATFVPLSSIYVSDMPFLSSANGLGPVERDTSNGEGAAGDGRPITLEGVVYPKGLGVHATSDVRLSLGGKFARFISDIGVDDEVYGSGSVVFRVYADAALIYQSTTRRGNSPTLSIDLDVSGANELRLNVTNANDGTAYDHADWAGARLVRRPLAVTQSEFRFATAPHALVFRFDGNVADSFTIDDVTVRDLTSGADVPREAMQLAYDAATDTATITFPGLPGGLLPDARLRATIGASGVISSTGNVLDGDHVFDFFFLRGDANHDARVDLLDFNRVAGNFGASPRDFTQGDFNYDGIVNLLDFDLLAARFGVAV